jgi:flagellin
MADFSNINRPDSGTLSRDSQVSQRKVNRHDMDGISRLEPGMTGGRSSAPDTGYTVETRNFSDGARISGVINDIGTARFTMESVETIYAGIREELAQMRERAAQAVNAAPESEERRAAEREIIFSSRVINQWADTMRFERFIDMKGASFSDDRAVRVEMPIGDNPADAVSLTVQDVGLNDLFAGSDALVDAGFRGALNLFGLETTQLEAFERDVETALDRMNAQLGEIGEAKKVLVSKEDEVIQKLGLSVAGSGRLPDTGAARDASETLITQIRDQSMDAALAQANIGPVSVLSFLIGA